MAVKTGLSVSAMTLDGNNHLGDLQMWQVDIGGTSVKRHGIAATQTYTQIAKRSAKYNFELVIDNTGPGFTGLDLSVWTPDGSDRLGDLQSGSLSLKIPVGDASGIADVFEIGQVIGARDLAISADMYIPSGSSTYNFLTLARSTTVSDWTLATVQLTIGGTTAFNIPMVLASATHKGERDGFQVVSVTLEQRGTPTTTPSGTTLFGVAYAGDALISLSENTGAGTWVMTNAVLESLDVSFAKGEMTKVKGNLYAQGQPGYS